MTNITRRAALRICATATVAVPLMAATARAASHAAAHDVTIENFAFSPADLTIDAGQTVTFTNADGAPHTATATDGSFDTGRLNKGESASLTFSTAGTYAYACAFHPMMKGTITVA